MSGNWNRTPRKGAKSISAVRSDQEHAVRLEYRDAGRVDGLVMAWAIAEDFARSFEGSPGTLQHEVDGAREVAMRCAECLLQDFPKHGRVALANAGASLAFVDAAENRAAARRRHLKQAQAAAKAGADYEST